MHGEYHKEKSALERLLNSNEKYQSKKTFQEKFNRFSEINLKRWEEEGKSDQSMSFSLIEEQKNEQKQNKNTTSQSLYKEKKNSFTQKLLQNKYKIKVLKNEKKLCTEPDNIYSNMKKEFEPLHLSTKENNFIENIKKNTDKTRFLSPTNQQTANLNSSNTLRQFNNKFIHVKRKTLDLKIISHKKINLPFLNDFNENMLKNRQNYSPSNFIFLNNDNNSYQKKFFYDMKHRKMKSLGSNLSNGNIINGSNENQCFEKKNEEKNKIYKVLHSMQTLKLFNFN